MALYLPLVKRPKFDVMYTFTKSCMSSAIMKV